MEVTIKINLAEMLRGDDLRQLLKQSSKENVPLETVVVKALEESARKSRETEPVPVAA